MSGRPDFADAAIVLVRHTEVHARYRTICYGQMDVELSQAGLSAISDCVAAVANLEPTAIFHSGLERTRLMADAIAAQRGVAAQEDGRLRELNFGHWQGETWEAIRATEGDIMNRIVTHPDEAPPHRGESLFDLRDRVLEWVGDVAGRGPVLAVSHGGPISMMRGTAASKVPARWPEFIPGYGEIAVFTAQDVARVLGPVRRSHGPGGPADPVTP